MSPMIVITLLFLGLIGAYFLLDQLGVAQVATGGATSGPLTNYSTLAIKVLMAVMVLYAIYYIIDTIRTTARERKVLARKAEILKAREQNYKS